MLLLHLQVQTNAMCIELLRGIMSPGYPQNYTPKSICVFAVNASAAVPIKVATWRIGRIRTYPDSKCTWPMSSGVMGCIQSAQVNFSTEEKFDALISDCQYFSGSRLGKHFGPRD